MECSTTSAVSSFAATAAPTEYQSGHNNSSGTDCKETTNNTDENRYVTIYSPSKWTSSLRYVKSILNWTFSINVFEDRLYFLSCSIVLLTVSITVFFFQFCFSVSLYFFYFDLNTIFIYHSNHLKKKSKPKKFSSNRFVACSSGASKCDAKIPNEIRRSTDRKDDRAKKQQQ